MEFLPFLSDSRPQPTGPRAGQRQPGETLRADAQDHRVQRDRRERRDQADAIAVIAEVTSARPRPGAATRPSSASDGPRRSPTRSSLVTSSQLVTGLISAPARNAGAAAATDMLAILLSESCQAASPAVRHQAVGVTCLPCSRGEPDRAGLRMGPWSSSNRTSRSGICLAGHEAGAWNLAPPAEPIRLPELNCSG